MKIAEIELFGRFCDWLLDQWNMMNSVNSQKTSEWRRDMPSVAGLGHVGIYTNDLFKMRDFYSFHIHTLLLDLNIQNEGFSFILYTYFIA